MKICGPESELLKLTEYNTELKYKTCRSFRTVYEKIYGSQNHPVPKIQGRAQTLVNVPFAPPNIALYLK